MKKLVWVAGFVLALSFLFPNGVSDFVAQPTPIYVVPDAEPDAKIVELLAPATAEEKARVISVYSGLHRVLSRDGGVRINNTEKWETLQANTLQLAIDQQGKYPGLDAAIEAVFHAAVQSDTIDSTVVNPVRGEVLPRLLKACAIIVASAK